MDKERPGVMSIKLKSEAIKKAKIAASFKEMTLMDYASGILLDQATRDVAAAAENLTQPKPTKAKR